MFTELVPEIASRLLHPVGVRNDKFRIVMANEMKPSVSNLSSRTECGDLLAMRLLQLFKLRNDKKLVASVGLSL